MPDQNHFPDILEDPILSVDIFCLTETFFYSGDNMKIDEYNCTQSASLLHIHSGDIRVVPTHLVY